jgi:hypothetical protein
MSPFDLRAYLDRFPEVCRKKFGRTYNFRVLEKEFEQLRAGNRWLAARDVAKIFDPARTPFGHYWPKPVEKELDQVLRRQRVLLAPLSSRDLTERLLEVFHNIGVASLILRFVHPARFGIISTPVVNLLQVHRPTAAELYEAFCAELREWQQHFRLASVADTQTALWTFHELVKDENTSDGVQAAREFDDDLWIQRRRAAQILRPFLQKYGALQLARILAEENPKLAGKIAGEEYERLLRCAARGFYAGMRLGVKGSVEILLGRLEQDGHITLEEKTLLRRTWETRNAAVHAQRHLTGEEVEVMIDTIERICRSWEKSS